MGHLREKRVHSLDLFTLTETADVVINIDALH